MKIAWKGYELDSILQDVEIPIPTDYVAYYRMNGNMNDETGDHNGVNNSCSLVTDRFGNSNSAYRVAGGSNNLNTSYVLSNHNFTFSWWLKRYDTQGGGFGGSNNSWGSFVLHFASGTQSVYCGTGPCCSTRFVPSETPNFGIANTWFMVTFTYENGYSKIYKNGALAAGKNQGAPNGSNTTMTMQNYTYGGISECDDLMIYDRTLSASEISDIYDYQKV